MTPRRVFGSPEELELYVESLYAAFGYSTKHNVIIGGQQIDVVAEFTVPGIGLIRTVVEAKHTRHQSVSNQEVFEFVSAFNVLRQTDPALRAVVITNATFTPRAKEAASGNSACTLLTVEELENSLLDLRRPLSIFATDYRSDQDFTHYIPLKAVEKSGATSSADAGHIVRRIVTQDRSALTVVLRDFGTGKSTFLRRAKFEFADAYLSQRGKLRPITFNLREFSQHDTLESYILHTVRREFGQEFSLNVFMRALNRGSFLLLCDGFDEISARSDPAIRISTLKKLYPLLATASPAIITCRPTYFLSDDELEKAMQELFESQGLAMGSVSQNGAIERGNRFQAKADLQSFVLSVIAETPVASQKIVPSIHYVQLQAFHADDIRAYLESFSDLLQAVGATVDQALNFLNQVYDLSDLVQRPLLLKMFTETVLGQKFDLTDTSVRYSAADVYDAYISAHLSSEQLRGETRQFLMVEERKVFAVSLALAMFDTGVYEGLTFEEIIQSIKPASAILRQIGKRHPGATQEQIANDVSTCAFLSRRGADRFIFGHKSFYEYFVAYFLVESLRRGQFDKRWVAVLPSEVLFFVGGIGFADQAVASQLRDLFTEPERNSKYRLLEKLNAVRENALTAWWHSTSWFADEELTGGTIRRTIYRDLHFRNSNVSNIQLQTVRVRELTLDSASTLHVFGKSILLNHVKLADSRFLALSNSDSRIDRVALERSMLQLRGKWSVHECSVFVGDVSFIGAGKLHFSKCKDLSQIVVIGDIKLSVEAEELSSKIGVFSLTSGLPKVRPKDVCFGDLIVFGSLMSCQSFEGTFTRGTFLVVDRPDEGIPNGGEVPGVTWLWVPFMDKEERDTRIEAIASLIGKSLASEIRSLFEKVPIVEPIKKQ